MLFGVMLFGWQFMLDLVAVMDMTDDEKDQYANFPDIHFCQGLGSPQYGQLSSESSKYSPQLVQRIAS